MTKATKVQASKNDQTYQGIILTALKSQAMSQARLARATRIHPAYLSRSLKGNVQLSRDQLYAISQCLGFEKSELHHLLTLHDLQCASAMGLREDALERLTAIKKAAEGVSSKLKARKVSDEKLAESYYSDPKMSKVHMMLTIEKYRSKLSKLCRKLRITKDTLDDILSRLVEAGVIAIKGSSVQVKLDNFHLPAHHPASRNNHINWRIEAINSINRSSNNINPDHYHFSANFTCTPSHLAVIRQKFLAFIADVKQSMPPEATDQELYHLTFDLFGED